MAADYHGIPGSSITNEHLRLDYLTSAGPRIVRLCLDGSDKNLLAETPEQGWDTPFGQYRLYGGHRLWHSPEVYPRPYYPDTTPIQVEPFSGGVPWIQGVPLIQGVHLIQDVEPHTGVRKSIEIRLDPVRPAVTLVHRLKNEGQAPIHLAPWAITQVPLGGALVLPQQAAPLDEHSLLPTRNLVLWPYSHWSDTRLELADDLIVLRADAQREPIKLGYLNRRGWVGYLHQGVFFVKRFASPVDAPYPDFGCNVEAYSGPRFLEAETLGPLADLEPGETAEHTEAWELYPQPEAAADLESLRSLAAGQTENSR